ncbi:MAG: 50S ribosomal protein L6 [Minisyncoccia bacterium]
MSKIGKRIIAIPDGVTVAIDGNFLVFKSNKGELKIQILDGVKPIIEDKLLKFELIKNNKQSKSNWGTLNALCNNAVIGLTKGFEKVLIIEGIGYRFAIDGNSIMINAGFSHPVKYELPQGITAEVEKNTILHLKGFDKFLVGEVAAEIRRIRKPEPYKGSGIRYNDEIIRRKLGKKAATSAAK